MSERNHTVEMFNRQLAGRKIAFYAALFTAVMTVVTFVFAMLAVPVSGANCPGNCVVYPYLNTAARYPNDFIWMPLAIFLLLGYIIWMTAIHSTAPEHLKVFSQLGMGFALMAALVLIVDYYVQFSIIPVSLLNGETEGLAALIQYNPHGVFIALEELGYGLMALSFWGVAPIFWGRTRLENAISWVFTISAALMVGSFAVFFVVFGMNRLDRLEVVILSTAWLVLIVNGILYSISSYRKLRH